MAANLKRGRAKAVARQKAVAKAHGAGSDKHKAAIATTKKYTAQIKKAQRAVNKAVREIPGSPKKEGGSGVPANKNKLINYPTNRTDGASGGSGKKAVKVPGKNPAVKVPGRNPVSGGGSTSRKPSGARPRPKPAESVKYVKPKRKKIKV